jgi:hypothetical protein
MPANNVTAIKSRKDAESLLDLAEALSLIDNNSRTLQLALDSGDNHANADFGLAMQRLVCWPLKDAIEVLKKIRKASKD